MARHGFEAQVRVKQQIMSKIVAWSAKLSMNVNNIYSMFLKRYHHPFLEVSIIDPEALDFPTSTQSDVPHSSHSSSQYLPPGLPSKAPHMDHPPP